MLGLLIGAALLGGLTADDNSVSTDNYDPWDEDMYHNYAAWRGLHDYGYNPATGCYNQEDEEDEGYY